jgi:ribosomal-protein-alanine N-acetyltransferase
MPLAVSLARSKPAAIAGAQVVMRPPVAADFEPWARLRHDSRNFLKPWEPTWASDELSKEAFRRRLRRYSQAARDGTGHIFFVFDKKTGALVGGCQLSNIRQGVAQSAATLGYWMGEPFAGKGLMTDAVTTLTRYCLTKLGLHRIEAACLPDNAASRRVLAKAGFVEEGIARRYLKINGQWRDHLLFAIIDDDLPSACPSKG